MFSLRFVIAAIFAALVPAVFALGLLASVRIVHNSSINPLTGPLPRPQLTEVPDWRQYYMQASLRVSEPDVAETRRSDDRVVLASAIAPPAVVPPAAVSPAAAPPVAVSPAVVAPAAVNPAVVAPAVVASRAAAPVLVPAELEVPAAPRVEERVVVNTPPATAPGPVSIEDVLRIDQPERLPVAPAAPPAAEREDTPPAKAGKRTRAERKAAAKTARAQRIEKVRAKRRAVSAARQQVAPTMPTYPYAIPTPAPY
jgi:hypothetical protein